MNTTPMLLKLLLRIFAAANIALLAICVYDISPGFRVAQPVVTVEGR
jgi:hypothetical protein